MVYFNTGEAMNFRPGDLAFIIDARRDPCWLGRIVEILYAFDHDSWITDPMPEQFVAVRDRVLWPIRPNDGQDETLTWAGLPNKETT